MSLIQRMVILKGWNWSLWQSFNLLQHKRCKVSASYTTSDLWCETKYVLLSTLDTKDVWVSLNYYGQQTIQQDCVFYVWNVPRNTKVKLEYKTWLAFRMMHTCSYSRPVCFIKSPAIIIYLLSLEIQRRLGRADDWAVLESPTETWSSRVLNLLKQAVSAWVGGWRWSIEHREKTVSMKQTRRKQQEAKYWQEEQREKSIERRMQNNLAIHGNTTLQKFEIWATLAI